MFHTYLVASLQDQEVRKVFSDRLRQHIKKDNILQQSLIARMPDILVSIGAAMCAFSCHPHDLYV